MKLKELYEAKEKSILTVMGQQDSKVSGYFSCDNNQLTSLEGAPQEVSGTFYCFDNKLTNLKGAPKEVGGDLMCYDNQLTSLEGCPQEVGGNFYCSNNKLTSLKGCPQKVSKDFYCYDNKLTNLKDIHKHIKFIGGEADFTRNPIKSHVVGLLLIDGLIEVYLDNKEVQTILNKYLKADRDVLACINELEEAGLSQFAQI